MTASRRSSPARRSARGGAPFVLAIGGLDPSCGAGIVADARTLDAMGAMPLVVATAVTVQSGAGVRAFHPLPAGQVAAQIRELARRFRIDAVKIGQVPTGDCARMLAREPDALPAVPVVLDPVLVASGSGSLVAAGTARAILRHLIPRAAVVTVNLDEARELGGLRITQEDEMAAAAQALAARGAGAVVIKGGHLRGEPRDLLWHDGRLRVFPGRRIAGSMHGTGCAFASALAASLARGADLDAAVRAARAHVRRLLRSAVQVRGTRLRAPARLR